MQPGYLADRPKGYVQDATVSAATSFTIPEGTTQMLIVCEAQAIRWRDDGTAPTAAIGMPLAVGVPFVYTGNPAAFQCIEQVGGAVVNVSFYGPT